MWRDLPIGLSNANMAIVNVNVNNVMLITYVSNITLLQEEEGYLYG